VAVTQCVFTMQHSYGSYKLQYTCLMVSIGMPGQPG